MPFGLRSRRGLHFVFLFAVASPALAQSIDELTARALATNREYLASLQRVREAEALLRQAGVRPAPVLGGEGGSTRLLGAPGSQEYAITYSHPLETGGKREKRVAIAALGLEIAQAEADERRRTLMFAVGQAHVEAVNANRRAAVLADIARIDAETLRLISARVDEGDAARLEKQLLETEIARNGAERALAEGKVETSLLALVRLGALAPNSAPLNVTPAGTPAPPSADELTQKALERRPDLRAARLAEEQARADIELARAQASPDITASARYAYRNTAFDQLGFSSAGVLIPVRDRENLLTFGFSVPLFSGRKNQANIEGAVYRAHEARLRREHLAATIPTEVSLALRNWEAARKALDIYAGSILPQAERNLNVIRQAWQLGQSRFLDVLNEQRRVTELRLAQVDAEAGVMKAWAEVEYAAGGDIR